MPRASRGSGWSFPWGNAQIPEADWPLIAKLVAQRLYGQAELFPETKRSAVLNWVDNIAKRGGT